MSAVEQQIFAVLRKYPGPQGVAEDVLDAELPGLAVEARAKALNSLLAKGRLQLIRGQTAGSFRYREISETDAVKFAGLSVEEWSVFQVIQVAKDKGMWTKDIRFESNLQQTQVTKALKTLEGRKLIKAVKSVSSANKKVYMLYELEPSRELTGGAFYNDSEFDAEFTRILNKQVFEFVLRKGLATMDDIEEFVRTSGISKVDLRREDMQSVISTLLYDGKLEERHTQEGTKYKVARLVMMPCALTSVPCGVCPVMHECEPGGVVSPERCTYFDDWLLDD